MNGIFNKVGLDTKMALGFIGVMIFMMGDGLEQGWLSSYLMSHGLTVQQSALLFSVYGFAVAIAAWLSGVLAEIMGPRKTMTIGLSLFIVGTVFFITFGIRGMNLALML